MAPDGVVYFSDITFSHQPVTGTDEIHAGHIWKFNPKTGKTFTFCSLSGMSKGIKFDANGNILVFKGADYGGRQVIRSDMGYRRGHV